MLDSLDIKNYRNLKQLRIEHLSKVNLITGKNNTGKSTILEAIALYAGKADLSMIYNLLGERGENFRSTDVNKNATDANIRALSSLFTNRVVQFGNEDFISIGSVSSTLFGEEMAVEKSVSLRFVKYIDEIERDKQGNVLSRSRIKLEAEFDKLSNFKVGLEIRVGTSSYIISLDEERPYRFASSRALGIIESYQFIRPRNIDRETNGKLWDNITLTEKEMYVIEALQIIEPYTERIAFIEESPRERSAVIKLSTITIDHPPITINHLPLMITALLPPVPRHS